MHRVAAHGAGSIELGALDHDDAGVVHIIMGPHLADGRLVDSGHHPEQSGLAGAIRTNQSKTIADGK